MLLSINFRLVLPGLLILIGLIAIIFWKRGWFKANTTGWAVIVPVCTLVVCVAFWGMFVQAWDVIATSPSTDPARGFITFCGLSVIAGLVLLAFNKTAQKNAPHFVGAIILLLVVVLYITDRMTHPRLLPAGNLVTVGGDVRVGQSSNGVSAGQIESNSGKVAKVTHTERYVIYPGQPDLRINLSREYGNYVDTWVDGECTYRIDSPYAQLNRDYPGNKEETPPAKRFFYGTKGTRPVHLEVYYTWQE